MYISRIQIRNYRNFHDFDVTLGEHAVIVGENAVGKSNLFSALGLILDPALPDSARELRDEDFWDGYTSPRAAGVVVEVTIEFSDFDSESLNDRLSTALLADFLVTPNRRVARLTYLYRPRAGLTQPPSSPADYEFLVYGGTREDVRFDHHARRRLSLQVFDALRDAERALANWRQSPLRPLLVDVLREIPRSRLRGYASAVDGAAQEVTRAPEIRSLAGTIAQRISRMVGQSHAMRTTLGLMPSDPDGLFRSLRIFIDERIRDVSEASLGSANILYLALVSLGLERAAALRERTHTVLGIEEPEAHLHPHLQRLVYRDFLRARAHQEVSRTVAAGDNSNSASEAEHSYNEESVSKILTTHSPHIVSVTPIRSLALLRRRIVDVPVQSHSVDDRSLPAVIDASGGGTAAANPESRGVAGQDAVEITASIRPNTPATIGRSTSRVQLTEAEQADLERYLDVSRGEMVFARGIVLVEGEAESYLVPVLARHCGLDLDRLGVTVCSISGTHFKPFLRVLGPEGLDIPTVVLTDWDPITPSQAEAEESSPTGADPQAVPAVPGEVAAPTAHGARRIVELLTALGRSELASTNDAGAIRSAAASAGVYTNEHTLEVDLFRTASATLIAEALIESGIGSRSRARVTQWIQDPATLDAQSFLRIVGAIGKGRFAQSLAKRLGAVAPTPDSRQLVPTYIASALEDLASRLPVTLSPTAVAAVDVT